MTITLHIGVIDMPYSEGKGENEGGGVTVGDVAEILENKYKVIGTFIETLGNDAIERALAHSAQAAVKALLRGGSPDIRLTSKAEEEIESAFRLFLDQREMDGRPGVPTAAALKGVNHSFKRPYVKSNPERPSFIDTGLYQASFKAWTDD